jgi:hypothetical protein
MYCGNITSNKNSSGITSNDITQNGGTFTQTGGTIAESPTMNGGSFYDQTSGGGADVTYIYYKVIYHANTGEEATSEVGLSEADSGDDNHEWMTITLPDSKKFEKDGCYISGWSKTQSATEPDSDCGINDKVELHALVFSDGNSALNSGITGKGEKEEPYVINFYAVWAQEAVEAGSDASYVVTIPAALSIGGFDSPAKGTVSATLKNFKFSNYLNVTVSSKNTYTLVDSRSESNKLLYWLYLDDSSSATNSDDSVVVATSEEEDTVKGLKNGDSVLVFKEKSIESETLTQGITAKLRNNNPVTVAGTYTDILTFTVNFK